MVLADLHERQGAARLMMQDDGHAVVYRNSDNRVLWAGRPESDCGGVTGPVTSNLPSEAWHWSTNGN